MVLFLLFAVVLLGSPGEGGQPPRIVEHPADSLVPKSEPVTLNCRAEGDPQPEITWFRDGKMIRSEKSEQRSLRTVLPSGSLFFLRVRKDDDAGVYACVAQNQFGEVTSRNASLEVATLRDEFRSSPQNTWVAQGETAVLDCEPPKGNPEPKVSWKKNGHPIDVKANGRYRLVGAGSLSISQVRPTDEGRYVCIAKNIVGLKSSNTALLRVTVPPQFTIAPANTSTLLGSDISLACVARGVPPPEIVWTKAGGSLPLKRGHFDEERFRISNVTESDAGVYMCVAENRGGSIFASALVTVLAPPILTVLPQNVQIPPNTTAYFGCEASGDPEPTIFWSREGSHSVIFQGTRLQNSRVTPEGTLQIDNVTERDEGFYFCAAVSPAGSVIHRVHLKVTRVEDLPPPVINVGPFNQTSPIGSVAVFPCLAEGNPIPIITWYKNGNSFILNHRIFTDDAGTLRINELEKGDSGMYECVASSRSGKYVWRAFLFVEDQNDPNVIFRLTGVDLGSLRPREPPKPQVVKVDATSVTIAWHPRYFSSPEVIQSQELDLFERRKGENEQFPPKNEEKEEDDDDDDSDNEDLMLDDDPFTFSRTSDSFASVKNSFIPRAKPEEEFNKPFYEGNEESEEEDGGPHDGFDEDEEEEEEDYESGPSSNFGNSFGGEEENRTNNLIIQSTKKTKSEGKVLKEVPSFPPVKSTTTAALTTTTTTEVTTTRSRPGPNNLLKQGSTRPNQITYKVEYYSPNELRSEWLLGATNVPNEVFRLQYLKPNTEYVFFVRTVTADGFTSAPSPISDPVKTLMSGNRNRDVELAAARKKLDSSIVVILKQAYPTSFTAIKIEWQIVNAGEYIEGFYIYYRKLGQRTEGTYQMLTVLNAGSTTFNIVSLDKYTTYQIFLLPFYKNVDGRPSNYFNVTTLQDVPSAPPEIVDTITVNGTALVVRWKPPPVRHQNGIILGYQLRVWSGATLAGNMTVNGSTVSLLLNNLNRGERYSLQIAAFTSKGLGVFSSMKSVEFGGEDDNEMSNIVIPDLHPKGTKRGGKGTNVIDEPEGRVRSFEGSAPEGLFSEAWFVALIGSIVLAMLLVFVFALYLRRCQLARDSDKLKVSTTEIPDGSMPPHYEGENLWIDPSTQKHLSLKSVKANDLNEYENANNYAVVEERHSPIPYATTTLINGEKHKSSYGGYEHGMMKPPGHHSRPPADFGMMAGPKMMGWGAGVPPNNKTGSLNICSQDMKKDMGKVGSLNVLTTFQTPLPGRKHMIVDFSNGASVNSILHYHEPRLNIHNNYNHSLLNGHNHNAF